MVNECPKMLACHSWCAHDLNDNKEAILLSSTVSTENTHHVNNLCKKNKKHKENIDGPQDCESYL